MFNIGQAMNIDDLLEKFKELEFYLEEIREELLSIFEMKKEIMMWRERYLSTAIEDKTQTLEMTADIMVMFLNVHCSDMTVVSPEKVLQRIKEVKCKK